MSEVTESNVIDLSPAVQRFVLHWGDMGSQWGVNRSVAQIHALLYLSERPLHAEEIGVTLGLARSNVSMSVKELLGWKLISRVPLVNDRRDHFIAETDLWQMLTCIAQGRKEREIDPAVRALALCHSEAAMDDTLSATVRARIDGMHDFVSTLDGWYQDMVGVPPQRLAMLIRMGRKIVNLLPKG